MPNSPVTPEIHQSLDVHRDLATKVTLYDILANLGADPIDFFFG